MSKEAKTTRELSYYELYLLDYLRQHKFTQQHDRDFIRTRADEAAETYEQERMSALTKGLHYSQYDILLGVIDSEFEKSVPPLLHEQLAENLLPFMGKVFSIYDLANDDFPLSDEYQNLHDELTGAVTLYLRQYGIQ